MIVSKRMIEIAGMVSPGNSVCDIGTDHAYIPIYLVKNKIAPRVIACDLREEPLKMAATHIAEEGVTDRVNLRLCDGLSGLNPGEAETITISGMGGELIISILKNGQKVLESVSELVLSPQTKLAYFREEILKMGLWISQEKMVIEDGKYYFIVKCIKDPLAKERWEKECEKASVLWGKDSIGLKEFFLAHGVYGFLHPTREFEEYLRHIYKKRQEILLHLNGEKEKIGFPYQRECQRICGYLTRGE